MIDAVVFDLDGLLIETEEIWDEVRESLARERGGRWSPSAQRDMMGMSSAEWSVYMSDALGLAESPEEINELVVDRMAERYRDELPLLPGAVEAVERMAERWPLAVASSSNRPLIDLVLELAGLAQLFRATVSSEEVGRGKPAPDVYLEAARRLGVEPAAGRSDRGLGGGYPLGGRRRDARRRDPEPLVPAGCGRAEPCRCRARLAGRPDARGGRALAPLRRRLLLADAALVLVLQVLLQLRLRDLEGLAPVTDGDLDDLPRRRPR